VPDRLRETFDEDAERYGGLVVKRCLRTMRVRRRMP
jgi:hypothetical protein